MAFINLIIHATQPMNQFHWRGLKLEEYNQYVRGCKLFLYSDSNQMQLYALKHVFEFEEFAI